MEQTGPMPLEYWLGDLADTSPAAPPQIAALAALGDMLDILSPSTWTGSEVAFDGARKAPRTPGPWSW